MSEIMWAVVNREGAVLDPVRTFKKDAIEGVVAASDVEWPTLERKYGYLVVKVKVEEVE